MCGGPQPSTGSLTSLLQDEFQEVVKSIQSCTAGFLALARAEKDETSQQLSQDGHVDVLVAGRPDLPSCKGAPGLREGGRTPAMLRDSTLGQSCEAKSLPRLDCPVSQSFARPCWPRLPEPLELGITPALGELPGWGSHHAAGAVLSCTGLGAELAPGREGTGDSRAWGKQGRKAQLQSLAECPNLQPSLPHRHPHPALVCREGETSWLQSAWLLTSSEDQLASK